jgi:integrase/recombinase XerD
MSDGGIPLRHIQSISGHKTLSALERYLDVSDSHKRSAIAKLSF